jgi:N-sulfoglucosamine sulfohydrolase
VQGGCLMPVLTQEKEHIREYLFAEFNFHPNRLETFNPQRTVRDNRYKLILNLASGIIHNGITGIDGDKAYTFAQANKYDGTWVREVFDRLKNPPRIELYDLQNDPYEKVDLSENTSLISKKVELLKELFKWMDTTEDPYLDSQYLLKEIDRLKGL